MLIALLACVINLSRKEGSVLMYSDDIALLVLVWRAMNSDEIIKSSHSLTTDAM